ncbi:MAG: asparagine synthase-related protein [Anaerolineae bacterium]|nr:asparagine synthase-related protein [Anaerolineae bacterium]
MDDLLCALRLGLQDAVRRHPAEVLLFSGGLDTSVLAALALSLPLLHVCLEDGGEDLRYAEAVARHLGRELVVRRVSVEEALDALPEVIRLRRTFDPALPNDLALYFAFVEARRLGFGSAMTGDGADELFAGYSYMFDLDLGTYIPWLAKRVRFSANELGEWFGMNVFQPYLYPAIVDLALSIPPELKVREENGGRVGKWVLRKAFEGHLPPDICWQTKRPIEVGSGFSRLRETVAAMLTDEDWAAPVRFFACDQPYYYRLYRRVVGEVPPPAPGEASCPACGAGMPPEAHHCRVCGNCL